MEGAKWMEIRSDRQKGMSFAEIARKYHLDPRTAKKYALSETKPVYKLSQSKAFYICS
jgi:transposase